MCGLSGEYTFDGSPPDLGAVGLMCEAMVTRGPDDAGAYAHGSLALGHRRLSVIDLSPAGHQPMVDNELGITVAFNGCIYNYRELRAELQTHGYRFFSTSDTEVIAKAYHRWGENFVDRLLGMFAIAIHERDSGRLVLVRDRLGIKPLYLAETPRRLRFASTLPALVRAGRTDNSVDTRIDPSALHHYLSWHAVVPAPRTIIRGVRKLAPATIRIIEPDGSSRERTYWEAVYQRDPAKAEWTERDWQEAVLQSLRTAVQRRLVADVPVGVLLSGGLDSSLVVSLLAEQGQPGLNTFSIGFEAVGGEEGDEFKYSDIIARRFDTEHHQIRIDTERTLPALQAAILAMSEPMVSHDVVGFFLLSQEVSKHVKVVQSGQGADEVFGGYHWYPPLLRAKRQAAAETYAAAFFDRDHAAMADVVHPEYLVDEPVSHQFVAANMDRSGADSAVDAALRLDSHIMLVDDPVKRVDNMTMAWGLEARVPFLDHELVELAAQCPPELKLAQDGKGVLKQAAREVVPSDVIDRPKGYFPVPALKYLRGPYLDLVRDALHAPAARERGLYRDEYVDRLLADPNSDLTPLRQPPLATRAAGDVAASARDHPGMSDDRPHRRRIAGERRRPLWTQAWTDAPDHLVRDMRRDVSLQCGWGRLIFAQTFDSDDDILEVLRAEEFPDGMELRVRRTANLHTGGTIHDVTAELHPVLAEAAITASKALDSPVTGIDLIVPDVAGPDYVFIEANERPGLANHEPQPTAERFVDLLFPATRATPRSWRPAPPSFTTDR